MFRSDLPLLFMRNIKPNQSATAKSGGLIASNSRHELPIIQQGENLLIDARLLHQQLKSGQKYSDWIKARIEEFGFELSKDFFASEKSEAKGRGGHNRIDYHLTLDMAKELAMVERNEIGRAIRRYFIQKEKEARGIVQLPAEAKLFAGIKPVSINGRRLFPYKEVLERTGYSVKASSAGRRHRYPGHFVTQGHSLYVTQEFATHLFHQKKVYNNRQALKSMQPVLPLNFGDVKELGYGNRK